MMSVNGEQNSTQASIIINMYERIDKGQTVSFIKLWWEFIIWSSPDNDENIHFFMFPLPQNIIKWIIMYGLKIMHYAREHDNERLYSTWKIWYEI